MLHSLFRACESFTFVTANWGQLDVTLPRTQNLVVTVLMGFKFGVGWVTTLNHKHYINFPPLLLGVLYFQENFPFGSASEDGQKGTAFVAWSIGGTTFTFIRIETSWILILLGQSSCVYCRHTHAHIHTHSTGWCHELNNWDEHLYSKLRWTAGINLKIGCTKILSAEISMNDMACQKLLMAIRLVTQNASVVTVL